MDDMTARKVLLCLGLLHSCASWGAASSGPQADFDGRNGLTLSVQAVIGAMASDAPQTPEAVPVNQPLTEEQIAALCKQVLEIFNRQDLGPIPKMVKELESAVCTDCSGPALQSTWVERVKFKSANPPLVVHKNGWLVGDILNGDDYKKLLKERPVLILGEHHGEWAVRELIYRNLSQMQEGGATYLAIEGHGYFEQPIFNAYFDTGDESAWAKLVKHIEENIKGPTRHLQAVFPLARSLGMRFVGIDLDGPVAECMHRQSGDSMSNSVLQVLSLRDRWMAARIRQIMDQEPEARFVVLVGQVHTARSGLPFYLKTLGIPSHTLLINANRIDYSGPELEPSPKSP